MTRRREAFFSLPALLLMGALVSGALYLLFPRQAVFEDVDYLQNPDGLSIAYLEVLLRSDRDNNSLRINLGTMLSRTGQFDKAEQTLAPLMQQEDIPSLAFETYTNLLAQQMFAETGEAGRERIRQQLFEVYQRLPGQDYDIDRRLDILQPAQAWLDNRQYLAILMAMQATPGAESRRTELARRIARRQEAAGDVEGAVSTLRTVVREAPDQDRNAITRDLIRLELAAGNPGAALALFEQDHTPASMDSDTLKRGMELARFAGDEEQYRRWLLQRARLEPRDIDTQRAVLRLQLGEGNVEDALTTVRRLQAIDDQLTRSDREQIARVLEWNNRPEEAMNTWRSLYIRYDSDEAFLRTRALARSLFRWDVLADVLDRAAADGRLQPDDYALFADALIYVGDFQGARRRLADGLERYPGAEALRARKLTLLINSRRYPEAIALLERSPNLRDEERLQLANLYWRIREPDTALALLDFTPDDPALVMESSGMRMDLAVLLGRTDVLGEEYQRWTARNPVPDDGDMQERLLSLAVLFGEFEHAVALSEARFETTENPRYLAGKAEYHLILGQYGELETTLSTWNDLDPEAVATPRYWTLTAAVNQRQDRPEAAVSAFQKAASLAPDSEDVLVNWAWFLISEPQRLPDHLPYLLQRLADSPGPDTYPVLAYGYSALGAFPRALHWFRTGLEVYGNDDNWLVSMASTLDQTGAHGTASDLRQQVAARMDSSNLDRNGRLEAYRAEQMYRQAWQEIARYQSPDRKLNVSDADYRQAMAQLTINQGNSLAAEAILTPENRDLLYPQAPPRFSYNNRALQVGHNWQNLGNFILSGSTVTGQFSHDHFRWLFAANRYEASGGGRLLERPQSDGEGRVSIETNNADLRLLLTAGQLDRFEQKDTTVGLEAGGALTDRVTLDAGYHVGERTPDSAEAWWLTARDRAFVRVGYSPFSRLDLSAQTDWIRISELNNSTLGNGHGLDLNATYTLFRSDPSWVVSAGYQQQRLSLESGLSPATLAALDEPITPAGLISPDYERIGISTRWAHGEPHALYRSSPSPRVFLGIGTGYVLSTSTPDFNVETGLGWRVLGDDELAISGRWSSENLDGNARTDVKLTYTLYFGH